MNEQTTRRLARTIGNQYYGVGINEDKALSVNYLENSLSIGVHSPIPGATGNGPKYDYKSGNVIYLTGKKSKALSRLLSDARDKMATGEKIGSKSIASATNLIEVCDGTKFGMPKGITLAIYNNVNETKTTDSYCVFQFRNEDLITDYDYKTGSYGKASLDTDVDYFIENLKEFSKAWCNASAHFVKKELDFNIDRITTRQIQCMNALGIQIETPKTMRTNWNSDMYSNSGTTQNVGSTNDLLAELNSLD